MEQQRETYNLMMIFLLMIANIHDVLPSSQNLYTTTIGSTDGDKVTGHSWLQPLNITTSIYQDSTTYSPTNIQAEEKLDSSETNVLNRFAQPFYQHNENREDNSSEEPPDHVIPYSEHEEARDVPTQPKYVAPGNWAKPPPEKDIPLDFVPTKLHAQVRGSHTVKRVPQRQAIESAETDEEKHNAPRLKEVVTNTKINTIYTEEGYEDSAYDHAGHIRDADFHEGFARKLHDRKKSRHNSSSGEKKGKNKNLVPDEFKEYEEDYQDHLQENRKFEQADDEDNLIRYDSSERSEINPKFVAESNIQKLEEDIEKDAEEAERSSEIYQNAQDSTRHNDINTGSSDLEEPHVKDNMKHENKSIKTKKKKSKLQNGKDNNVNKKTKQSHNPEQKKKLYSENYETTVLPFEKATLIDTETPASPHGFVKISPNPQIYSIDQTTQHYIAPITIDSFQQIDEPTTVSYNQLFWDYFKARQGPSTESSTESSTLVSNSTINPQQEIQTPIAVATIDGHGPYLLVTKKKTVTSEPSIFLDPRNFRSRNLFSDHVEFGPTSAQTHGRHLLGQNGVVDFNNMITTSTITTSTSVPSLSPEGVEYSSSTTLLDIVSSSTPAVMTLNFSQEAYARMANYHENPFLGPVLDNSNIAVTRNKLKYKVLARAKPSHDKKSVKSVTQSPHQQVPLSSSKEENGYKKIHNELNANYNKMLNYIKNKQETQSLPKEKKIFFEDITLRRPPLQRAAYSILTNHPSVNRSSISTESESSPKADWRSELQNQHRSQPVKLPFPFVSFAHVQPVHPIYHKNSFPTTKLLPPPLSLASTYANYHGNKQNDNHHSYRGGKPQQRREPFKYFPKNPEASWRTRSRRKRSDKSEFRDSGSNATDVDVKATANNGVTNDNKSEQRNRSSFGRVIDRSERKSSPRVIDASVDVPDAIKLVFPTRSSGDESGTSRSKNSVKPNSERKNVEDARKISNSTANKKGSISIQSTKQNGQINDMEIVELTKNKRDVNSKTHLIKNLKNEIYENDHEELLKESPKISGDIIDKEIAERFNEKTNEMSPKKNGKVEIEVPNFDSVEELVEDNIKSSATTEAAVDLKKYPFYNNEDVPSASALKYVIDPEIIPRKTLRGMEFYDSRNAYKQCDEVEPNLDEVLPEKEEPDPERGPQEDLRLRGLGDKLDCFKAKYFDENPLDNPLFAEKLVEEPTPPTELNPTKFASKIIVLPEENDEYVVPQVSKKPERSNRQGRDRIHPYETLESIRVNYKHDPQTGRGRNAYFHTVRGTRQSNMMRRVKNRKSRPKSFTPTPSSKLYQTASYQNQVYEDVMGNIRNMKNAYQVYEMTTLSPSTQILATAGSENTLEITDGTSKKKSTSKPDVTDNANVMNNTKSLEIKGLVPPPKYLIPRLNYRKHRPLAKNKISFIRSPTFPRIIAHHIKINKRSTTDATSKNFSESMINENKKATVNGSIEVVGNDTLIQKITNKTNVISEPLDLEIKESRPISIQDRNLSTLPKIDNKKKRRNSTDSDLKSEPQKIIYTIKDRIRHSKPKWNTRGFGKFTTSSKIVDEDSRRKEPRYNHIKRKKKLVDNRKNNSTIMNSTESTSRIESATSLTEDRESSTTELYHAEESVIQQMIYHNKDEHPEVEKAENINTESEKNFFQENKKNITNTYQVHENIDENVSTTTNPQNSKKVRNYRKYLKPDPPEYVETFSEDATMNKSNKYRANMSHESEDSGKKQEEKTDYPINITNQWENDSSEKIEEQVETPIKTKLFSQNDDSEELSSKEDDGSNQDQTFFTYTKRPSLIESDKDDEQLEKTTFYKSYPFSKYESKKESEENNSEEESEEESKDYIFPWHGDKKNKEDKRKWLYNLNRFEYPWERRDRLARERKRKRAGARIFDDEEDEKESIRFEQSTYPWEKYDVPSKIFRVNTRRHILRKYIDDSEESNTEDVPKYSSRYSSSNIKPTTFSTAREISRAIKKFLEEDESNESNESKEKTSKEIGNHSPSVVRKSSPSSDRGISRGMLVPEDITQPPKKKKVRRKISQVDKNVTNNLRFDSKKLGNDTINEEKEEESIEYPKLNKSYLNDSELPAEVISSQSNQITDGTKKIPSATEQRKKRRKILKNNFTVSLDNVSAESVTKPTKKRRRKPEVSTTTPATSSASISSKKLTFTPNRKRYSKKDEKTNKSDFSETTTVKTIKADNFQIKTSTPKIRTIEHRSKVSKEKIVMKTTYPNNETKNFDSMKINLMSVRKEPVKSRSKSRRRKNNIKPDDNNEDSDNKRKLIKQEYSNKEGNFEVKFVNGDEIKKSVILDKPQSKSRGNAFGHFGMKKEEVKKINDFGPLINDFDDGIVNDDNDNNDFGISSEIYAERDLMQNIPSNGERNRFNERTESELNNEKTGITKDWKERNNNKNAYKDEKQEDMEQKQKIQTKFIKDPEHRLYYYVDE